MSKLDNIILECANRVLDGKEEKLGDYIDPTKESIKALMLEIIGNDENIGIDPEWPMSKVKRRDDLRAELRKKVAEL